MKPLQMSSATSKPLRGLVGKNTEKSDLLKESGRKTDLASAKADKAQKNEKIASKHNLDEMGKGDERLQSDHEKSTEIDEYLKVISRLENKVKKDDLPEEDLEKLSMALEEKILTLNEQQKVKLKRLDFFKAHGIDNLKTLKKTLVEMFNDKLEQESLFEFLKSQEFITLLLNDDNKAQTYSLKDLKQSPMSVDKPQPMNQIAGEKTDNPQSGIQI